MRTQRQKGTSSAKKAHPAPISKEALEHPAPNSNMQRRWGPIGMEDMFGNGCATYSANRQRRCSAPMGSAWRQHSAAQEDRLDVNRAFEIYWGIS